MALVLLCGMKVNAYDFSDYYDGRSLYYNIIDEVGKTVEVTYDSSYGKESSMVIPSVAYRLVNNGEGYTQEKYSVVGICQKAFQNCSNLYSITLPNTITAIGENAFSGCNKLEKVNISDLSAWCGIDFDGIYSNPLYHQDVYLVLDGNIISDLVIPDDVEEIKRLAFHGYTNLKTVKFSSSVKTIGKEAFQSCKCLISITIPKAVTKIEWAAFALCERLRSIAVDPENVIYDSRDNCNAIIETETNMLITGCGKTIIPNTVTEIGEYAFAGNREWNSSSFQGMYTAGSITIPESVAKIGQGAFFNCSELESITIGRNVKAIETSAFASSGIKIVHISDLSAWCGIDFDGIYSNPCGPGAAALYLNETILRDLVIPDDVEEIKQRAFYKCGSLRSVTIPKSVTSVGAYAFADCVSLQNVKVLAVKPPFAYANTFSNYNIELCVPINVLASYQDTAPWNKFGTISTVNISITDIVLNQSSITLSEGEALALTATINPDNATNQLVTWSSSDTCVATVDTNGKVAAIAPGTTVVTVTANDGSGVKASCVVAVEKKVVAVSSITLSQSSATLTEGETLTLTATVTPNNATDKSITWSSSNTTVATVDADGVVTAIAPGTATITAAANDGSGVTAACEVTVEKKVILVSQIILSQTSAILTEGETLTLTATVTPDNADNTTISWSSSNEDIAMVSSKGKVVAMGVGTATITATANDGSGVKASCVVTVEKKVVAVSSITLSQSSATMIEGETLSLTATVKPTDATNKGITWSSSNMSVATVDDNGKVTAVASGTTYITATANDGSGVSASCEVTVLASYTITYMVDGEVYHTETLIQGSDIVVPEEPTKEGYTFSGWSTLPETMPTHDVIVNGSFTINKYVVTFTVGGVVIVSDSLEYGAPITVPTMPAREGYTFSGWSDVAETVPASDVTYDACYVANIYKVYYFVGTAIVHIAEVAYGEAIPEYIYEPTAEGDVFMGWIGDTYDTMPAHDVVYTANIVNGIEQTMIDKGQFTIYDLSGRKVTDTENLKGGIYIVNGRKVVIK